MDRLKIKSINQIKPVGNYCLIEFIENFTKKQLEISSGGLWVDNSTKQMRELYLGKVYSIKDKVFRDNHWMDTKMFENKKILYTPLRATEIIDENNKIYHLMPSEDLFHYEVSEE